MYSFIEFSPNKWNSMSKILCTRNDKPVSLCWSSNRTPVNFLLVNLAVADMVVAIFLTPQLLSFHVSFTHPDGLIGTVLCKLLTTANFTYVGAGASVFTLICISVERYFNVLYPHGAKGRLTKRKLKVWYIICKNWNALVSHKSPFEIIIGF